MEFGDLIIYEDKTVKEAMLKLDETAKQILFVVGEAGKLLASLSDGDVRRFLLSGGDLEEPVINAGYLKPKYAPNLEKAKELYNERYCFAVPVVDENLHIIDIYYKSGKHKDCPQLGIPVVINAGGRGTRLDPYTRVLPKPLVPVGELPIIELIMQEYIKYGCNEFHMIVNYKKQLIKAYFNENDDKYDLTFYDETKPLGTGGGLCFLKNKIESTFFFTNCDNLLRTDYDSIVRFHKEHKSVITIVCAYKSLTIPYGVVQMGVDGLVNDMQEKPNKSFFINTGIYVVEPEVLNDVEYGVSAGFPDIIELQRKKGRNVFAYPINSSQWMDMGQITELDNMRKQLYGE